MQTLIETWTSTRLRPGTVIAGESVIFHDKAIDGCGRWFGLVKIGIETEFRYPSLEMWSDVLKEFNLLAHSYTERSTARSFSGRLWIYYKEYL